MTRLGDWLVARHRRVTLERNALVRELREAHSDAERLAQGWVRDLAAIGAVLEGMPDNGLVAAGRIRGALHQPAKQATEGPAQ